MVLNPTIFLLKYLNLCLEELYRQHTIENTQQVFGQRGSSSCTTACITAWRSQKIKFFCLCLLFCNPPPSKQVSSCIVGSPLKTFLFVNAGKSADFPSLMLSVCYWSVLRSIRVDGLLTSVDFTLDGTGLVVGSTQGKIYQYDLRNSSAPTRITVAHKTSVTCLRFQSNMSRHKVHHLSSSVYKIHLQGVSVLFSVTWWTTCSFLSLYSRPADWAPARLPVPRDPPQSCSTVSQTLPPAPAPPFSDRRRVRVSSSDWSCEYAKKSHKHTDGQSS